MNGRAWDANETSDLSECQSLRIPQRFIAVAFSRTVSAIKSKASELGCVRAPFWTPAKKAHALRMREDGYTYSLICELMDCTMAQLKGMLHRERRK